MSLSGPLRGSFYSVFWRPRIPASLSSIRNFGIIQVIQWVQPRGSEFWKQQLITNSECCVCFSAMLHSCGGWKVHGCLRVIHDHTLVPEWVSASLGRCPYLKFTLQRSDLHFSHLHFTLLFDTFFTWSLLFSLSNDFEVKVLFLCGGNVMTQKQDDMSRINLRTYLIWILFQCNQVVGYITYKSSLCFQFILLCIKIQFLFLLFLFIIISRPYLKITYY